MGSHLVAALNGDEGFAPFCLGARFVLKNPLSRKRGTSMGSVTITYPKTPQVLKEILNLFEFEDKEGKAVERLAMSAKSRFVVSGGKAFLVLELLPDGFRVDETTGKAEFVGKSHWKQKGSQTRKGSEPEKSK